MTESVRLFIAQNVYQMLLLSSSDNKSTRKGKEQVALCLIYVLPPLLPKKFPQQSKESLNCFLLSEGIMENILINMAPVLTRQQVNASALTWVFLEEGLCPPDGKGKVS